MDREKKTHEVKCDAEPFKAVWENRKKATFRKLDRDYHVGDALVLMRYADEVLSGERIICEITHIETGYGIPEGYGMISFQRVRY